MSGFREHALGLAARGLFVFPCDPVDKTPRTERGHKDATTSPAQIEAWANWHGEDSLVGIATLASGLLVVDLDEKDGKHGVAEWARLCAEHKDDPHTHTVRTRSGGFHLYFRGVGRTTQSELAEGIDTRGGFTDGTSGGYVIAWPDVVVDVDMEPAPGWLLELLTPRAASLPTAAAEQVMAHVTPPELRRALTHAELLAFVHAAGADVRPDVLAVAYGKPWGVQGGREVRLSALCLALVREFPWLDPEGTSYLFEGSCRAVEAADGASTTIEWVAEKLSQKILPVAARAAAVAQGKIEHAEIMACYDAVAAQSAALKAAAKRQTPETRAAIRQIVNGQQLSREGIELAAAALARVTGLGVASALLEPVASAMPADELAEKLAALVDAATKTPINVGNEWILGTDQGYFLKAAEGYEGPFSAELTPTRARDTLAYVDGLSLGAWKGTNWQPKPTTKLLNDYGRVPGSVHYCLYGETRLQGDRLLYNALAMPELEAEYNPEIASWLGLLAGDQHEAFLDWLATFLHFERPTCAVMIQAFPGVGKGLLIDGMAALFNGKAVAFAEAIGPFSARMSRCPVVVADETLAAGPGVNAVDELKKLVGDSAFSVADKYIRAAVLEGCVRVILATNHHGGFRFGRELTVADVAALDQRVLLLHPVEGEGGAADYLVSIGGRERTAPWVEGKGLARHVLWLAENRQVKRGSRFLVEGRGGLTDLLAGDSKGTEPLLRAIARGLHLKNDSVAREDGSIWVCKRRVLEQWDTLSPKYEPPNDMGAAWDLLCEPGTSKTIRGGHGQSRYCRVKTALVFRAMAKLGLSDLL